MHKRFDTRWEYASAAARAVAGSAADHGIPAMGGVSRLRGTTLPPTPARPALESSP